MFMTFLLCSTKAVAQSYEDLVKEAIVGAWSLQKITLPYVSEKNKAFKKEVEKTWIIDADYDGTRISFTSQNDDSYYSIMNDTKRYQSGNYIIADGGDSLYLISKKGERQEFKIYFQDNNKSMGLTLTNSNGAKVELIFKKTR